MQKVVSEIGTRLYTETFCNICDVKIDHDIHGHALTGKDYTPVLGDTYSILVDSCGPFCYKKVPEYIENRKKLIDARYMQKEIT